MLGRGKEPHRLASPGLASPPPPPTSSSSPPSWKTGMFEVPCSHALLKPGPLRVINTQQHAGPFSITVARANFKRTFQPPPPTIPNTHAHACPPALGASLLLATATPRTRSSPRLRAVRPLPGPGVGVIRQATSPADNHWPHYTDKTQNIRVGGMRANAQHKHARTLVLL